MGLELWRHRRLLTRMLMAGATLVVAVPLTLALMVTQALGATGVITPGGALGSPAPGVPVKPMASWTVTQEFGCTGLVFEPPYGNCAHFRRGIDLAAAYGTPVVAVLPGLAHVVRDNYGYGLHVLVEHVGGTVTLYGHLALITVADGAVVSEGQELGLEGSTGNSTGPHLHFEVRQGGAPVPPRQVFPSLFGPGGT